MSTYYAEHPLIDDLQQILTHLRLIRGEIDWIEVGSWKMEVMEFLSSTTVRLSENVLEIANSALEKIERHNYTASNLLHQMRILLETKTIYHGDGCKDNTTKLDRAAFYLCRVQLDLQSIIMEFSRSGHLLRTCRAGVEEMYDTMQQFHTSIRHSNITLRSLDRLLNGENSKHPSYLPGNGYPEKLEVLEPRQWVSSNKYGIGQRVGSVIRRPRFSNASAISQAIGPSSAPETKARKGKARRRVDEPTRKGVKVTKKKT
ncbi:hypothetical protein BJ508DRAFT_311353 [Ascobolus immersus RN42]|uniref:Uncharacterized protein n=1 Tax=Ascobolus immersus RN42 TaxID=1160509 RepID=A0A3N4HQM5_ASCIM|nr:hypothetical protein BJ508DRAFT_311353 [Ascobolus immersus RN42]